MREYDYLDQTGDIVNGNSSHLRSMAFGTAQGRYRNPVHLLIFHGVIFEVAFLPRWGEVNAALDDPVNVNACLVSYFINSFLR